MSRYIDADEVLEQIRKKLGVKSLGYLLEAERQIVDVIQSAPSIDIVRCKECMYWHKNRKAGDGMNVFDICYDFQADDFCSYGEREGE